MHRIPSIWPLFPAALPLALLLVPAGCTLTPFDLPSSDASSSSSGGPECSSDADCDDQNPCTRNLCTSARTCAYAPRAAGTPCGGDGNACNGSEACDGAGMCVAQAPPNVDDGNLCTADACDPASGQITHKPISGCIAWKALPQNNAPSPRERHTAVWTGSKMIVWGGLTEGNPAATATGGIYDPAAQTWSPTSMVNAPPPRHSHTAIWTGSTMIVWGGYGLSAPENTGGIYDPATNTWTAMSTLQAPQGRTRHTSVWSNNLMMVWGGLANSTVLGNGGLYDPAADAWTAIPAGTGLDKRYGHTAISTGSEVLLWGGGDLFDWLNDGRFYDPAANTWGALTTSTLAPDFREAHSAVWTGNSMIVWGGWNGGPFLNDGGIYEPDAMGGKWTAMAKTEAPSPRRDHIAVWTGNSMIVWGGCGEDSCGTLYGDGGVFTPGAGGGAWTPIPVQADLSARRNHTAVWTGSEVIVWGGKAGGSPTNTGASAIPND